MTEQEQIEMDARLIEQVMLSPAWEVITRRIGYGVETFTDLVLIPGLDPLKTEAFRARVIAYKELLDLPALIRSQIKQNAPANDSEGDTPTEA